MILLSATTTARLTPLLSLVVAAMTLNVSSIFANDVILSGFVLDQGGNPLDVIRVAVETAGRQLLERTVELKPGGEVSMGIGSLEQDHLRCKIFAEGFDPTQITVVVREGRAHFGTVQLKRYVELGPLSILEPAYGGFLYLDFWITSHSSQPLTIKQVVLSAEEPVHGPCFEAAPRLAMRFEPIAFYTAPKGQHSDQELRAILQILPESKLEPVNTIRVAGSFHRDPCGPSVIKLLAPFSFTLETVDKNQPRKLRVEVPLQFKIGGESIIRPNWHDASLHIVLENGDTINVQAGRRQR